MNAWNEALRLKSTLADLGVEEGEIAFPGPGTRGLCMVSQAIAEAPAITPTQAAALRATLGRFRTQLEGRSVRLEAGTVNLFLGDSGDFLLPFSGCSASACACSGGRRRPG